MNKNDLFEGFTVIDATGDFMFDASDFPMWNIQSMTGYEPKTTFWEDFSMAEQFGMNVVNDLFCEYFVDFRDDVVSFTELVLVLNWKIWQHHKKNDRLALLYDSMWRKASEWAMDNLKGEDLDYYYRTTD